MQEVITIVIFAAFSTFNLGQAGSPRQWAGSALVVVAADLIVGE